MPTSTPGAGNLGVSGNVTAHVLVQPKSGQLQYDPINAWQCQCQNENGDSGWGSLKEIAKESWKDSLTTDELHFKIDLMYFRSLWDWDMVEVEYYS